MSDDTLRLADAVLEALEECERAERGIAHAQRARATHEERLKAVAAARLVYDDARLSLVRAIREAAKPVEDD
jgi:hypothetical protein